MKTKLAERTKYWSDGEIMKFKLSALKRNGPELLATARWARAVLGDIQNPTWRQREIYEALDSVISKAEGHQ